MPEIESTPPVPHPRGQLGHPTPVEDALDFLGSCITPLAVLGGAGAFLLLASGMFTRTAGSRRSTRLQWQEQQQNARAEIEARIAESGETKKKSP